MSMQINPPVNKTAKPVVAGVFQIIIGSFCMLAVLGLLIASAVVASVDANIEVNASIILVAIAVPVAAVGGLCLAGGIFSLKRRMWGVALAGSIASAFVSNVLGVAAIVLTAVSKDEFAQQRIRKVLKGFPARVTE